MYARIVVSSEELTTGFLVVSSTNKTLLRRALYERRVTRSQVMYQTRHTRAMYMNICDK